MVLQVNGHPKTVPPNTTVTKLLFSLSLSEKGVAVAINRVVVPHSNHSLVTLCEGDNVEVIQAVGGG